VVVRAYRFRLKVLMSCLVPAGSSAPAVLEGHAAAAQS
jgi:hypothetical protein